MKRTYFKMFLLISFSIMVSLLGYSGITYIFIAIALAILIYNQNKQIKNAEEKQIYGYICEIGYYIVGVKARNLMLYVSDKKIDNTRDYFVYSILTNSLRRNYMNRMPNRAKIQEFDLSKVSGRYRLLLNKRKLKNLSQPVLIKYVELPNKRLFVKYIEIDKDHTFKAKF